MEALRDWFLIMLYLHKKALPKTKGGSPSFYASLMELIAKSRHAYYVHQLFEHGMRALNKGVHDTPLINIRKVLTSQEQALFVELPSSKRKYKKVVLFQLTALGEQKAQQLISSELSETAADEIKQVIASETLSNKISKQREFRLR